MADDTLHEIPPGDTPEQMRARYASNPLGHLFVGPDPRTPEERAEAQRKENKRRGSRRKNHCCSTPRFW